MPHCEADECHYLCRHNFMITCTCYDYQQGHLCKHTHKVYSVYQHQQDFTSADTEDLIVSSLSSPSQEPLHIGVIPSKANREETGERVLQLKYT